MSLTKIVCFALGLLCLAPVAWADEPMQPVVPEVKERPQPVRADRSELRAELRRLGMTVLRNERVTLHPQGLAGPGAGALGIDLVGVDDYHAGVFPGHGPDLPRALTGRDPSRLAVLLAHQPAAIEEAAQLGIDLQISGHTHAGQLWPWGYFVRLQQPYVHGLHCHGSAQIYVSAGTGYWGPPMRLASEAEITELVLRPRPS